MKTERHININAGLLVSFLLLFQFGFAQTPTVTSSTDKNTILIGEQLHFNVRATVPDNNYRLSWFNVPDSLDGFTIAIKGKIDSVSVNGILNLSQTLTLTNFDSGRRVIPPLALKVESSDGDSSFNLFTDSAVVNVTYSPLDSIQPFHDIKTIVTIDDSWPWWVWALIGLVVVGIVFLIIYLVKTWRKKSDSDLIFSSKLSPYEEALELFTALKKDHLVEDHNVKEFHTRLSEILKRYLSRKTNKNQFHLTVDEILVRLKDFNLERDQLSAFSNTMHLDNAVKFAQFIPDASDSEKCFLETKNMITAIHQLSEKKAESDL